MQALDVKKEAVKYTLREQTQQSNLLEHTLFGGQILFNAEFKCLLLSAQTNKKLDGASWVDRLGTGVNLLAFSVAILSQKP